MIQNIEPHKFDNQFKKSIPCADSIILSFRNNKILCSITDGNLEYPRFNSKFYNIKYLFSIDNCAYFLADADEFDKFTFVDIQKLRACTPKYSSFAGFTGYHLYNWYSKNIFCSACGERLFDSQKERALLCKCGNIIYPRIDIAVIVGVIRSGRLLLTRYSPEHSTYRRLTLVAGYTEIGEIAEETVAREVFEEVGIKVKDIKYFASQPWGLSGGLLLGYFCYADDNAEIIMDKAELCEAKWLLPEEIDFDDDDVSLTNNMIAYFKNNMGK